MKWYFVSLICVEMELRKECRNKCESFCDDEVIKFKELTVWTPEEISWWRRKLVKPKMVILDKVTGSIKDGDFVAVIGPSGAGKTTFLVALAGKCTLQMEGIVTIKGKNVKKLQGMVEIVPQMEVFMDNLSVMEHLVFMTEMKLGSSKKPTNQTILNRVAEQLKLKSHANTFINALSGGERRLLSLANSLLSSPQILICDEPTTGLDSYNAALVIGVLKMLSLSGKIVICSVHQPSSDLFKEFSSVMLMADGKLLYHGSLEECKALFDSLSLHCPNNYNPADFYIRAVSTNPTTEENYSDKIMEAHNRELRLSKSLCECDATDVRIREDFKSVRRNWFKQVYLLMWRWSLVLTREMRYHLIQLFISMAISAMIIGTCYVGISGTSQRGIQDLRGFLWLVCSEVSFGLSYCALGVFESEISLFRREVGMYSASAYLAASFMSLVPRMIMWSITFVIIATLAVQLPNHFVTAVEFIVALLASAVASTAYGLGMGALFTSSGLMTDVMSCSDLPLFLMSGAFLRISSLPFWLYPLKYISHFFYSMDALSNIYWRQIENIDCPTNSTTSCLTDGVSVLSEDGYSSNFVIEDTLGLLFVTSFWSLLSYYGLKKEEKKGYAY